MSLVNYYDLSVDEFSTFLKQLRDGDDRHAADAYAFPVEDRTQLEADIAAWDDSLSQVNLLAAARSEVKQTRDAVRPAREWARGQFPPGDERSGEYGLDKMPPDSVSGAMTYGRTLLEANTAVPPLDPALPERLLTPVQAAFAGLETDIADYQAAVAAEKQAVAARKNLRRDIHGRVRGLRQYLYTYVGREDPVLVDYGLAE